MSGLFSKLRFVAERVDRFFSQHGKAVPSANIAVALTYVAGFAAKPFVGKIEWERIDGEIAPLYSDKGHGVTRSLDHRDFY